MYIDIATDFLIDEKDIVGIFDLDNTTAAGKHTINFLNEKQKEGKKRMRQIGNVEVPQKAFMSVLKLDED